MSKRTKLKVMLDAGVPDSVGKVFGARGDTVIYHRDVLADQTTDEVVCVTAVANNAILIAIDAHMKRLAKQYGVTPQGDRFDDLSIIRICRNEVLASKRVEQAVSLIDHEWDFLGGKASRRMWIDILPHQLRTHR